MKKIMIFGIGPLSIDEGEKFHGGGNRAWHLAKPLADRGFEVILVCMRITDKASANGGEERREIGNIIYYSVDELTQFADDGFLRAKIREHKPDALAGACAYPASRAAAVADDLPVWADFHGYPMGEAQAKAAQTGDAGYLHHFWNIVRPALQRADRFSVTSERHRMALIGELGAMGRLNQHNFLENFVTQIPIAWCDSTPCEKRFRFKEDSFTVFFSGGYNNWCDAETLFKALETAMDRDPRVRFLSTGGAIDGHDEVTYPRFQALVEQSRHRGRFDLRGWVSRAELRECQSRAHLGINVDLPCYETLIGARNRITEFNALGIPVLTTLGTEISQVLFFKGLILTAPVGSPEALAGEIVLAANHPEKMQKMAEKAREYFEKNYTYQATAGPFVEWCRNPVHCGDFGKISAPLDYSPFGATPPREGRKTKRFLKIFNKE